MYLCVHVGIALLDGMKGKGMSKPYHVVGGRERKKLRQAFKRGLEEEGGVGQASGWQQLRSNLLKLEKNVRWSAVGEGYKKDRDRLFL